MTGAGQHLGNRGGTSLGRSPFGATAPSITAALLYGVAGLTWVGFGTSWPGGRWFAVHLFTLGVLTNLVLVFSEHFGRTLTRTPDRRIWWQVPVVNIGILMALVGMPSANRWAVASGATVVTTVVLVSYLRLRTWRRGAIGARFVWIVRTYERAHGAFVHGAILGLLMGVGALSGPWYGSARLAHLHVNVLGWGGLTLLATLVFFGPTIVRTRIVEGADDRAARALRHGATGLTVGVVLLLLTAVGGVGGYLLRVAAAAGIGVFAWAATVTCWPVAVAARRAKPSSTRWPVVAVSLWLPAAAWADVAVIASGRWGLLDAVGLVVLLGVLGQMMATVLVYLTPMLRVRHSGARGRLLQRFEHGAAIRAAAYNLAVAAVAASAMLRGPVGFVLSRTGWTLIIAALVWLLAAGIAPVRHRPPRSPEPGPSHESDHDRTDPSSFEVAR